MQVPYPIELKSQWDILKQWGQYVSNELHRIVGAVGNEILTPIER